MIRPSQTMKRQRYLVSTIQGTIRPRMIVRSFPKLVQRDEFLRLNVSGNFGEHWRATDGSVKPGIYAMVNGRWVNVRKIPDQMLMEV